MRISCSLVALLAAAACSSTTTTREVIEVSETPGVIINGETLDEQGLRDLIDDGGSTAGDELPTSATPSDAFAANLATFETDASAVNFATINNSRFVAIPTTGSADYAGFLRVNAGPTANLAAQVDLTANFATGVISGEQTSPFFGATTSGLDEYEGDVDITYGRVGAKGVANNARVDFAGTIQNDVNTIVVDAEIVGKFRGTPIEGIAGSATVGDDLSLTLNGTSVTGGTAAFAVINN
jgi:hypothetical protein